MTTYTTYAFPKYALLKTSPHLFLESGVLIVHIEGKGSENQFNPPSNHVSFVGLHLTIGVFRI